MIAAPRRVGHANLVVRGAYLSKVEIGAVPTGTEITPDEYTLLGQAQRQSKAGRNEVWVFPIPSCETDTRLLAQRSLPRALSRMELWL